MGITHALTRFFDCELPLVEILYFNYRTVLYYTPKANSGKPQNSEKTKSFIKLTCTICCVLLIVGCVSVIL